MKHVTIAAALIAFVASSSFASAEVERRVPVGGYGKPKGHDYSKDPRGPYNPSQGGWVGTKNSPLTDGSSKPKLAGPYNPSQGGWVGTKNSPLTDGSSKRK